MKALLATAYPTPWTYVPKFELLAAQDRFGVHCLCRDPEEADIILFVDARHEHNDWQLKAIRQHPLTRRYRNKTFLYNEVDQPYCALPGLYVSMPRQHFDPHRQRACGYVTAVNQYMEIMGGQAIQPDYLFSFMGRRCHTTRETILNMTHPRGFVQDTSAYDFFTGSTGDVDEQKQRYADVVARSKFVLCPRGAGPASFRLFEALAAGRVPVIISDEWVAPIGPDWDACSLRVREADVAQIPALLEAGEARYEPMAQAARCAWEQWFASDVMFYRMIESCHDIMQQRRSPAVACSPVWDTRYLRLRLRELKAKAVHFRRGKPAQ